MPEGNKYGILLPIMETSTWWGGASIILGKGEIAWEVANPDTKEIYMLIGDGEPVNKGSGASITSSYRRLRYDFAGVIIQTDKYGNISLRQTIQNVIDLVSENANQLIALSKASYRQPNPASGQASEIKGGTLQSVFNAIWRDINYILGLLVEYNKRIDTAQNTATTANNRSTTNQNSISTINTTLSTHRRDITALQTSLTQLNSFVMAGNFSSINISTNNLTSQNIQANGTFTVDGNAHLKSNTTIMTLITNVIRSSANRAILQFIASTGITLGNNTDHLTLRSNTRPSVVLPDGTNQSIAFLSDFVGSIFFQFAIYSFAIRNSPPINDKTPPVAGDIAIVSRHGTQARPAYLKWSNNNWVFDSWIEKPDGRTWQWLIKHHKNTNDEPFTPSFLLFSGTLQQNDENDWSIINIPLELYRTLRDQDVIDDNTKEWLQWANNSVPDWLETELSPSINRLQLGIGGAGSPAHQHRKRGYIANKPPILLSFREKNVIDGGDENDHEFIEDNWGAIEDARFLFGYIVDGGDEESQPFFRYFIQGGNELFLPKFFNQVFPRLDGTT